MHIYINIIYIYIYIYILYLDYFSNEAFKTVGYHGGPTKKICCYRVAKNSLKLDFQDIKFVRTM